MESESTVAKTNTTTTTTTTKEHDDGTQQQHQLPYTTTDNIKDNQATKDDEDDDEEEEDDEDEEEVDSNEFFDIADYLYDDQFQYNNELERLEEIINTSKASKGDYYCTGTSQEMSLPSITIEGIEGKLSYPIQPVQVRQLVEKATRAPYGKGTETIIDLAVRKVWQIPATDIKIVSKRWNVSFTAILGSIRSQLGLGDSTVTAELYKMLVYEEGGFFLPHRDSEKTDGMFGTLVISLPCRHKGGELVIDHRGKSTTVSLENDSTTSQCKYVAFYADCRHEVKPVTQGNRVCLVYNLMRNGRNRMTDGSLIHSYISDSQISKMASTLRRVFNHYNEIRGEPINDNNKRARQTRQEIAPGYTSDVPRLVYALDHVYSLASFSLASLKGKDEEIANLFIKSAKDANVLITLGFIHIKETGNYMPGYKYNRVYHKPEYENGEFSYSLTNLRPVVETGQFEDVAFDASKELFPNGALDGAQPFKDEAKEATGNAGSLYERLYHRSAIVIWDLRERGKFYLMTLAQVRVSYQKSIEEDNSQTNKLNELTEILLNWSAWDANKQKSGLPDLLANLINDIIEIPVTEESKPMFRLFIKALKMTFDPAIFKKPLFTFVTNCQDLVFLTELLKDWFTLTNTVFNTQFIDHLCATKPQLGDALPQLMGILVRTVPVQCSACQNSFISFVFSLRNNNNIDQCRHLTEILVPFKPLIGIVRKYDILQPQQQQINEYVSHKIQVKAIKAGGDSALEVFKIWSEGSTLINDGTMMTLSKAWVDAFPQREKNTVNLERLKLIFIMHRAADKHGTGLVSEEEVTTAITQTLPSWISTQARVFCTPKSYEYNFIAPAEPSPQQKSAFITFIVSLLTLLHTIDTTRILCQSVINIAFADETVQKSHRNFPTNLLNQLRTTAPQVMTIPAVADLIINKGLAAIQQVITKMRELPEPSSYNFSMFAIPKPCCANCTKFNTYLASGTETLFSLKGTGAIREHIERYATARSYLVAKTEGTRAPYTLTVTKSLALLETERQRQTTLLAIRDDLLSYQKSLLQNNE
ncbi:serine/threonine protein kinase [Cavenderia fasciculata]|uniref:Serine/threonine protein kinase n=1 Tax=Cavenderia fasciculata TaxID=261658 RepID=F4PMZ7_CACFS|nr:serine/threonine protein kinase [Cavenderia fasciculata]EGG22890.1 serine/threonine protein kinase [Cavenderia fasciculata]|eukprot:XP_004360741.1 serine/threonine protein kinase [Cavenderia fasciculata]